MLSSNIAPEISSSVEVGAAAQKEEQQHQDNNHQHKIEGITYINYALSPGLWD